MRAQIGRLRSIAEAICRSEQDSETTQLGSSPPTYVEQALLVSKGGPDE